MIKAAKVLFAASGLALCVVASPVTAQEAVTVEAPAVPLNGDPAKVAIAKQILDLGIPEDTREKMFFATTDQIVAQMIAAQGDAIDDPGVEAITMRYIDEMVGAMKSKLSEHIPSLMEAWAHSYANMFTTEELNDILAFVSTPSGARFFSLNPAVVGESNYAAANQAYMNEAIALIPAYKQALMEELFEYMAARAAESDSEES